MTATSPNSDNIIPHRHPFVKALAPALTQDTHVQPGDRILIALSSGADSVALTRALHALAQQKHHQLDLHIAHIHHHIRPIHADADAQFAQDLADQLSLPFHLEHIHPTDLPGNLENNARTLRYDSLTQIATKIQADHIATAHHADDQLETLLMRLIRGAALTGLASIRSTRHLTPTLSLIRPMLQLTHDQAIDFLNHLSQPWQEDHTNTDTSLTRARLRADVLPVLRSLRPDAAIKASQAAANLASADQSLRRLVRRAQKRYLQHPNSSTTLLARTDARKLSPATLTALLRNQCRALGAPTDALTQNAINPITSALLDNQGSTRTFQIQGQIQITLTQSTLTIKATPPPPNSHPQIIP